MTPAPFQCCSNFSCAFSISNDEHGTRAVLSLTVQVFELNMVKAWGAVATTLISVSASLYLISVSPWYLLPFAWFIAGTAFTGVSSTGRAAQAEQHRVLSWQDA